MMHPPDEAVDYDCTEGTEEDEEERLSWRLDPLESHSDWTLQIRHASSGLSDTYHVHKNILAVGPCKSDYFVSLFRCTHLSEAQTNTSHIVMEDLAAQTMPMLLDFIYHPAHNIDLTVNHAVALRYLAKYFGIRMLYQKVMEFNRMNMNLSNIASYIADAVVFHDETMLSLAANKCIDNLQQMDDVLLESIDSTFLLRILSNPEIDTCSVSSYLSKLIAKYCLLHQATLDKKTFDQLTDRKFIPQIDREAAISLLEVEAAIIRQEGGSETTTSCLQRRCIKVLALHWKDIAQKETIPSSIYHKLPPNVLVELLDMTTQVAKQNLKQAEEIRRKEAIELRKEHQYMLKEFFAEKVNFEQQLEKVRQESKEKSQHLRSLLAEKDRQLAEYRREWDKMVRVPPGHKFQDVRLATYHHLAGHEPFDNPNPTDRHEHFGRVRPTSMPRIGQNNEDGYLLIEQEGFSCKYWPVFYYKDG